jgi:CBS domain-containing protein
VTTPPQDPIAFLRATPPFDALPPPLFDLAAGAVEVAFFPAGEPLARAGGEPLRHLHVIRKGVVRIERDGQLVQLLEEGETFGYTSLITGAATLDVTVEEDLLAYLVPAAVFERLLADARFAGHFAAGLGERLRSSLARTGVATFPADLAVPVGDLLRGPAAWMDAGESVGAAAREMHGRRISSVLVRADPPGIVTDRDFRSRVLAQGLGPETPLAAVMSRPLRTVDARAPVYDAWATLLEAGVHHLAVTRGVEIAGVLTSTDLLRHGAQGPLAVLRGVERLRSRAELPGYAGRVAEMVSSLLAGGLDLPVVTGLVARLNDALVRRILAWAEAELGPPPVPWAWLALGSEGRMEQTLLTDQDNAIAFGEGGDRSYFEALGSRANDDLAAAGFPRCPGGVMACQWAEERATWVERIGGWLDTPTPEAVLHAAIFADFRRVAGPLDVAPLGAAFAGAAHRPLFLTALARAALAFRAPSSLALRLRANAAVDLKRDGIGPVVLIARAYGLQAGGRARETAERLRVAAELGLVDAGLAAAAAEAHRFLGGLRVRQQLAAIAEERPVPLALHLDALDAVQRSRLKDALRSVRALQDRAAQHFQAGM